MPRNLFIKGEDDIKYYNSKILLNLHESLCLDSTKKLKNYT